MQTPDIFWGLTATGWTAIGSIVGAVSIAVLSLFNWRYLVAAKDSATAAQAAATSAHEQAVAANRTLKVLEEQSIETKLIQEAEALGALKALLKNAQTLRASMHVEQPPTNLELLPTNWTGFMIFITLHRSFLLTEARAIEKSALETQKKAINYISGPYRSRSTVTPASEELKSALEKEIASTEMLIEIFYHGTAPK